MSASNNNQNHITIIYQLDEVKKTFQQYKKQEIQQTKESHFLPDFLRIEKNNGYNTCSGFNHLLRLRDASNWSVCTRLGLKPTGISNLYYTDLFIENRKVLCIVFYPKENGTINETVELNIFPKFYPCEKSKLSEKVKELVQTIAHKKGI
ncbi:MAG: hypothetical protein ACN6OJ_10970 [Chryseobacterium sp.]|uniref:hypothetical protein n=1 Tax=Chryseobacterium sp. TaxID=1871047 RepID=UPI003D0A8875